MIKALDKQTNAQSIWQQQLKQQVSIKQLVDAAELPATAYEQLKNCDQLFSIKLPQSYFDKIIGLSDPFPLLAQFLPNPQELAVQTDYSKDPLDEQNATKQAGLLQKYLGRALLITTGSCPIHCRYCFRRSFPYSENRLGKKDWMSVFTNIQADETLHEVILSGGDPLSLTNQHIKFFLDHIGQIPHIKTIRIHSRFPTILPDRIEKELSAIFQQVNCNLVLVTHINHPLELDEKTQRALQLLRQANVTLLNQSVLLKSVNDSLETLSALSHRLFEQGVLPYYLHLLDKVQGTAHFDISESLAKTLHQQMRETLPGYLVPKLVREIAGEKSKTPI